MNDSHVPTTNLSPFNMALIHHLSPLFLVSLLPASHFVCVCVCVCRGGGGGRDAMYFSVLGITKLLDCHVHACMSTAHWPGCPC